MCVTPHIRNTFMLLLFFDVSDEERAITKKRIKKSNRMKEAFKESNEPLDTRNIID